MNTLDSPFLGPADLGFEAIATAIRDHSRTPPAYAPFLIETFARKAVELSAHYGQVTSLLVGQMMHETNWLRFGGQVLPTQFNFAGLGSTNDGAQGATFLSVEKGISAVIAHRAVYFFGPVSRWPPVYKAIVDLDSRIKEVISAGYGAKVSSPRDFTNGRWAFSPGVALGSLDNGYAKGIVDASNVLLGVQKGLSSTVNPPHIAISAGHHNSDGGNAFEVQQTGEIAHELILECRRLGMIVTSLTPDEGHGMDTVGLQAVARRANTLHPPAVVFLEVHTEGGGAPGVFAIYPDWGSDVDVDVQKVLGPLIAKKVAAATKLSLGAGGDGVMSEKQTGVGASGSRLGVFLATEPIVATGTRLIVEYGSHDKEPDLTIAKLPGFAKRCAAATASALAEWLHWSPEPDITIETKPTVEGHTVGPIFASFYDFTSHGAPLGPMALYSDGNYRQLFENVVLEATPEGKVRQGGLGQAYVYEGGRQIVDWPFVHPFI